MKVMKDWWDHFAGKASQPFPVGAGRRTVYHCQQCHHGIQVCAADLPAWSVRVPGQPRDFGFPGIDLTLFGIKFKWYIIGYGAEQGGAAYFTAYMIAMLIGEMINFFVQRSWVFRSKGNILRQGMWYLLAFCVVTCIVNSINCAWAAVAGHFVAPWLYNIGTTVLNGGVSMVVFFIVNKIVFNNNIMVPKK